MTSEITTRTTRNNLKQLQQQQTPPPPPVATAEPLSKAKATRAPPSKPATPKQPKANSSSGGRETINEAKTPNKLSLAKAIESPRQSLQEEDKSREAKKKEEHELMHEEKSIKATSPSKPTTAPKQV